jgi:hypothetical protein
MCKIIIIIININIVVVVVKNEKNKRKKTLPVKYHQSEISRYCGHSKKNCPSFYFVLPMIFSIINPSIGFDYPDLQCCLWIDGNS